MTEIMPGIHRLKVVIPNNPLGFTNSYLVQGNDGYTIIDPGMNNEKSFRALRKELAEAGVAIEDISRIITTHAHGDHYGLSRRIKRRSKAPIFAHRVVADSMKMMTRHRQDRGRQMEDWLLQNGAPPFEEPPHRQAGQRDRRPHFPRPVMPDVALQGNETISINNFNFKVIWTPGHDPGHICLYEADRKVLFSGDHVLPITTPHVNMQSEAIPNPLGDFLHSLESIKLLDADIVLPGHEETFTDLKGRVEELIQHHHQRNDEILEALKDEAKTAYQISTEIIWMPVQGGVKFKDLSVWHQRMAVSETLAHLKLMELEGKVSKLTRDGIIYYQRA